MENNQKINVNVENGVKTLRILHGDAMPEQEPTPVQIHGHINTVCEFLRKRKDLINVEKSHITVDKINGEIKLVFDEDSVYSGEIKGSLTLSDKLKEWIINQEKSMAPVELARFMKMRKNQFYNREDGMKVINSLMSFKAKVNKELDQKDNMKGNIDLKLQQTVEHYLPATFALNIPLFKNGDKLTFSVEFVVNSANFQIQLISEELEEFIENEIESEVNRKVEAIKEITNKIPIIEV